MTWLPYASRRRPVFGALITRMVRNCGYEHRLRRCAPPRALPIQLPVLAMPDVPYRSEASSSVNVGRVGSRAIEDRVISLA
jgi:hypothetical protein